jgi:alpha-glucosidase (family GH31 glycosyl hydrolase)
MPLFVKVGSILPLGSAVQSTHDAQTIEKVRVYPGADASFTLFSDDGMTYAYEKGAGNITTLHWNDASQQLTHEGPPAWSGPDNSIVEIAGH